MWSIGGLNVALKILPQNRSPTGILRKCVFWRSLEKAQASNSSINKIMLPLSGLGEGRRRRRGVCVRVEQLWCIGEGNVLAWVWVWVMEWDCRI